MVVSKTHRLMRPLLRCLARPMKVEWKMSPYLGVLPRVLSARNRAFSAPRICTVDDCGRTGLGVRVRVGIVIVIRVGARVWVRVGR